MPVSYTYESPNCDRIHEFYAWHLHRKIPVNYALLSAALAQMGPWKDQQLSIDCVWCVEQLRTKIRRTDWPQAREDVRRFVKANELPSLDLWGEAFFLAQVEKLA